MLPSLFLSDNKKWQRKVNVGHVVTPTRPFYNALQYFVANNLLGEWGPMQMTVMSESFVTALFFFYKNIIYKNIEAEVCEILRIF